MLSSVKGVKIIILSVFFSALVSATEKEGFDLLKKSETLKSTDLKEVERLHDQSKQLFKQSLKTLASECAKNVEKEEAILNPRNTKSHHPIFIFVSFSLSDITLKALYQDAEQAGATLVLRGLKKNSFKETAKALQALQISLQIDPHLFKQYDIQTVPTFIEVQENTVNRFSGNVSLTYVLQKFQEGA